MMRLLSLVTTAPMLFATSAVVAGGGLRVQSVLSLHSYDRYHGESVAAWDGWIATARPGTQARIYDTRDLANIVSTEFGHSTSGYGCRVRFFEGWVVVAGFGESGGGHNTFGFLNASQNWEQFYYNGNEYTSDADYGVFPIFRSAGSMGTTMSVLRRTGESGTWQSEGDFLNAGFSASVLSSTTMLVKSNSGSKVWSSDSGVWVQTETPVPPYVDRRVGDSVLCLDPFAPLPQLHRFSRDGFSFIQNFPLPPIVAGFTGVGIDGDWAVSGDLLAIGAPQAAPDEVVCGSAAGDWNDGLVLIYRRLPSGGFAFLDVIHNPAPTRPTAANGFLCRRDMFGRAVAWEGRRLVVGCAGGNAPSNRATIHVFNVMIDCDANGVHDADEIAAGAKPDVNGNGIPDSCEFPSCPGEVTGNGTVDGVDLAAVLSSWGSSGGKFSTDINLDGVVNGADLTYVLSSWGECP